MRRTKSLDVIEKVLLEIRKMLGLVAALVALQVAVEQLLRGRPPAFERDSAVVAKMLNDVVWIDEVPATTDTELSTNLEQS